MARLLFGTRKNSAFRCWSLIVICSLVPLVGCGDSLPERAPVHGRVTFNGKPLAGADVTFMCTGAARFSVGRTDDDGNYTLSTYEPEDGAIIGHNVVIVAIPIISQDKPLPDSPMTGEYFELMAESKRTAAKSKLPASYADPTTSGLSAEVTAGENVHNFKLTSGKKK